MQLAASRIPPVTTTPPLDRGEAELCARARRGDAEAFELLARSAGRRLYGALLLAGAAYTLTMLALAGLGARLLPGGRG